MKKALPWLLALLLLLAGCELRNRRPSSDFVPSGTPAAAPGAAANGAPQGSGTVPAPSASAGDAVKTVFRAEAETLPVYGGVLCHYEVPFLDLPGVYAAGCNQEINERFETPARASLEAVQANRAPVITTVDYTWDVRGGVLTLRLHRRDLDGSEQWGIYSVDAETGEKVPVAVFCEAAGIPADGLHAALQAAVEERFRTIVGGKYAEQALPYTTALTQTLSSLADLSALSMHLTEDGRLSIAVPTVDPDGGRSTEEIILP